MEVVKGTEPLGRGSHPVVFVASSARSFEPRRVVDYQRNGVIDGDAFELARVTAAMQRAVGREYYNPEKDVAARAVYYQGIDTSSDSVGFYRALSAKLQSSHTHHLEYGEARYDHLYPWVDLHPEDLKLHGVYTDQLFEPKKVIAQDRATDRKIAMAMRFGARVGGLLAEVLLNSKYNCEHSVPQSYFGKREPMRGDLHCLFTANIQCNSLRGSLPYGEVGSGGNVCSDIDGCGEQGPRAFEPERNKGAVARATLYFLMRYPGQIDSNEIPRGRIEVLKKWSREEPPSLWELHRNAEIAKAQGNRNPLIDNPDWVGRIDFMQGYGR